MVAISSLRINLLLGLEYVESRLNYPRKFRVLNTDIFAILNVTVKLTLSQSAASKGNHLWEFVREMLKDSACNPSLIKWEDKAEGVFRFMQSEMVAKKWGEKKRNPGMTYEKLSRAMRWE